MIIERINREIEEVFYSIKDESYPFWLDSCTGFEKLGRYSIVGFNPTKVFSSKLNVITLIENGEATVFNGDPLDTLDRLIKENKRDIDIGAPFKGGFVGYFGYDSGWLIEELPDNTVDDVSIPDIWYGLYEEFIILDNKENKMIYYNIKEEASDDFDRFIRKLSDITLENVEDYKVVVPEKHEFESNMSKEYYLECIDRVKEYIRSGDIYQANFTQRFETEYVEDALKLYYKLRKINPAPFSSFFKFDDFSIVSSSPERFIKVKNDIIETRPIKGTRPRGKDEAEDRKFKEELLSSEKDKSELLMIVDLERNDLSRVAKTGTVDVTELFVIEEYATVNHLVSTVVAKIKEGTTPMDIIRATFPGGSITGAPKIRSMQVIDELEPTKRNLYTGSIGYISLNGDMDLNIVIRTIVLKDDKAYLQVGGGIVWDSDPYDEYEESLTKAKALFKAINS